MDAHHGSHTLSFSLGDFYRRCRLLSENFSVTLTETVLQVHNYL